MVSVISDGIWLDSLAPVGGLTWTETCPGGMASATWTMGGLPRNFTHPCLLRGKKVQIKDGPYLLGTLVMSEPERSTWTFTATGLMVEAANFPCVALGSDGYLAQSTDPNAAVDYAISVGLPWTRPASLGAPLTPYQGIWSSATSYAINDVVTWGTSSWRAIATSTNVTPVEGASWTVVTYAAAGTLPQITTVADLLAAVTDRDNTQWTLSASGAVSVITLPTAAAAPTWLLTPGNAQMDVADTDYYSDLYGLYNLTINTGTVGAPVLMNSVKVAHVANDATAARFGRRMKIIDLTALGTNTDTTGTGVTNWNTKIGQNLSNRLAQTGGRLGFTNEVDVLPYQLTSVGGVPAHLEFVRPGQKVRMFGVLDGDGNATPGLFTDFNITQVDHSATDPIIKLTPFGFTSRDITTVVADAVAATTTGAAA